MPYRKNPASLGEKEQAGKMWKEKNILLRNYYNTLICGICGIIRG